MKRRDEAANVRHNRVVTGYIQAKYPEAYKEAQEFFQQLDAIYPKKKDLRRTNEYVWMRNDFPLKKYYVRKNNPKKKEEDNSKQNKIVNNMELIIPLMSVSEKANEVVDMSGEAQTELIIEQPHPMTPDTQQVVVTEEPLPDISDERIADMIDELTKDPELEMFFNDFDFDFGEYNEETPLERELLAW